MRPVLQRLAHLHWLKNKADIACWCRFDNTSDQFERRVNTAYIQSAYPTGQMQRSSEAAKFRAARSHFDVGLCLLLVSDERQRIWKEP